MRAISRLGLVSTLLVVGCGTKPTAPPRPTLPARADLGGLVLVADKDDLVARFGDGPFVRIALAGPSGDVEPVHPTALDHDTGLFRVALEGSSPIVITRGDPGSVALAAPAGRELTVSLHGAFAFAPGSHFGDARRRDVSWALAEQGGRFLAVGPSRARVDGTTVTASGASLVLSWGDASSLGAPVTRGAAPVIRIEPAVAGKVGLFDDDGRAIGVGFAGADGVVTAFSLGTPKRAFSLLAGHVTGGAIELSEAPAVVPAVRHGHLDVHVVDPDVAGALACRIVVRGVAGTPDPTFGSPERATGAGPIVDTEDGTLSTVLVAGKYKVFATHGVEYSADSAEVTVAEGAGVSVDLRVRRVVPTPAWISADLHVHSRGSFDSLVSLEDRVRSLVAAGVDFAAATEHNRVGTYATAVFPSAKSLAWVPSVEVTTVNPLRGHFNVIPWEDPEVPHYQQTTLGRLVDEVKRRSPASLVQVNHPRLDGKIGYFWAMHADPKTEKGRRQIPRGFHALEVYNGFDLDHAARVDEVFRDYLALLEAGFRVAATGNSDSHTVQYVGAGYPRTYVRTDDSVEPARVVEAVKAGHAFATSGPLVWLSQGTAPLGDPIVVDGDKARVRVIVKAAPWIALRSFDVYVGGEKVVDRSLVRAASFNVQGGPLASLVADAVALDEELVLPVKAGARAVVVVVRGGPGVGDALGVSDFSPLAISNTLWLGAH